MQREAGSYAEAAKLETGYELKNKIRTSGLNKGMNRKSPVRNGGAFFIS